tara:strand:+ start:764 stop:1177 length:414 start_codon:yes stop_codon:yes gene_type:complete
MFKGLIQGAKDRFTRAVQLAKTARETGKRGVTPELGVGEFVRGFIDKNLAKSDAEDPKFTANLKENIKENVPEDKQALFERDLKADKDRQKQEWLAKTANSPAAKAGMSDDMRWRAHLKNQAFRKEKGRSYSHGDFL